MHFEIIGEIREIEIISIGGNIRDIMRIQKKYGKGRWRKLKGIVKIKLISGSICDSEIHWYEAHGIGKVNIKIKRILG
jgi:threonine dehydrogenase-like Zn-dependent dehydrogenase